MATIDAIINSLFFNLRPALFFQRFYRYHDHVHSKTLRQRSRFGQKRAVHALPYMRIFKKAFPQCFNVFFTFFVTLSVFPVVLSGKYYGLIMETFFMTPGFQECFFSCLSNIKVFTLSFFDQFISL